MTIGNRLKLRIGDEISKLKEYFPEEYAKTSVIKLRSVEVNSTMIPSSKIIDQKSDVFLYIHHKDGAITEIGTWEQYQYTI